VNHRGRWGTGSAGITFIEVAVVLTLIGVLLTLAILAAQRFIQHAKASATASQMGFVKDGLLSFAANCEGLPLSAASGGDPGLVYPPANTPCWTGPYLARWPTTTSFGDGTSYRYQGTPGTVAALSAQALTTSDALVLGSEVAPMFGGHVQLDSSSGRWSVTVAIGDYYRRPAQ
jgi:type II secretory pathway pseudopilin PulG